MAGLCKRCMRPYVRPFSVIVSFPFCETSLSWEGCADCAYAIKRQAVDFMMRMSEAPRKVQRKLQRERNSR